MARRSLSFVTGYDASYLNGLQAMPQWLAYFGHPTGSKLVNLLLENLSETGAEADQHRPRRLPSSRSRTSCKLFQGLINASKYFPVLLIAPLVALCVDKLGRRPAIWLGTTVIVSAVFFDPAEPCSYFYQP